MQEVKIYDTTLRDGTQAEDFTLSMNDKLRIALKLDELGIHFAEGGWPGSNPKDREFFKEIQQYNLKNLRIAAFGATHHPRSSAEADKNLAELLDAKTPVVTVFGKSWTVHVKDALQTTPERNLELIRDSLAFLRPHVETLFYDAEHFFDGFVDDPEYALATLGKAIEGGAECLILCDTNGGNMPARIAEIIRAVKDRYPDTPFGIHSHNDSGVAVANSLTAVELGAVQVQGTMNGVGERCGNADLCVIIPNLCLKMDVPCLPSDCLRKLRGISRFVMELANVQPNRYQPYLGRSAFAHKGGVHISAVNRNPRTYEHVNPEDVGNLRRVLVSDLSGRAAIRYKARDLGIDLSSDDPVALDVLEKIKELEHQGYQYEAADASLELLIKRAMGQSKRYFELIGFRVIDEKVIEDEEPISEATIRVKVGGKMEHTAALGHGPVNALDNALRKALGKFYESQLKDVELVDYKVRVLPSQDGTASNVRVLVESQNRRTGQHWGTVGVSHNIIEASYQALVDSINYALEKSKEADKPDCPC